MAVGFSFLTLLFFYLALRATFRKWESLMGSALLGCNYFFVMYNRVGLSETPLTCMMMLTFFFWQKTETTRKPIAFFLLGVSCFTTFVFKNIALYFVVATALAFLIHFVILETAPKNRIRNSLLILAGVASVLLLWLFLFYLPNLNEIRAVGQSWSKLAMPRNLDALLKNILRQPIFSYFQIMPLLLATSFLFAATTCYRLFESPRKVLSSDTFVVLWLILGVGSLAILNYRPDRYYVPIVPPMCYLAARLMTVLLQGVEFSKERVGKASAHFVTFLWLAVFLLFLVFPALNVWYPGLKSLRISAEAYLLLSLFLSAVLLLGIIFAFKTKLIAEKVRIPIHLTQTVTFLLLVAFFFNNGKRYFTWARDPQYKMVTVSRELGTMLKPESYIAGLAAASLCLENNHRVLYAFRGWFNDSPDLFEKYAITHILAAEYNTEMDWYQKSFPQIIKNARLLKTYYIWRSNFFLYEIER